jgi:hypothetical protein
MSYLEKLKAKSDLKTRRRPPAQTEKTNLHGLRGTSLACLNTLFSLNSKDPEKANIKNQQKLHLDPTAQTEKRHVYRYKLTTNAGWLTVITPGSCSLKDIERELRQRFGDRFIEARKR